MKVEKLTSNFTNTDNEYRLNKGRHFTVGDLKQILEDLPNDVPILLAEQNGQGSLHAPWRILESSISDIAERWGLEYLKKDIVTLTENEDGDYNVVFNTDATKAIILDCSW